MVADASRPTYSTRFGAGALWRAVVDVGADRPQTSRTHFAACEACRRRPRPPAPCWRSRTRRCRTRCASRFRGTTMRQRAVRRAGAGLAELVQRSVATERGAGFRQRVGVAGLGEHELAEPGTRPEHAVLGPLERGCPLRLGQGVRIERRHAVGGVVVHRHPPGLELLAVGVQVAAVGRCDVLVDLAVVEHDRVAASAARSPATPPVCRRPQVVRVARGEPVDEAVRLLGIAALTVPNAPPESSTSQMRPAESACTPS